MLLSEIASHIGGRLEGPDVEISRLNSPEAGKVGELVAVKEMKLFQMALASGAALLLDQTSPCPDVTSRIRVASVQAVWPQLLRLFDRQDIWASPGVHPSATVEAGAQVDPTAAIGAYVLIRKGAKIAASAVIGPYSYVGEDAEVGERVVLEPRVTLYRQTVIGAGSRIGTGSVLGLVGFGFHDGERLAHSGRVVLEENVELGALTVVQRSLVGQTRIGAGSKIGDFVNVGHNSQIGKNVVMVGFGPIGGSTIIEDEVVIGGNFVLSDHVRLGKGARILGGSGISKEVPPGQTWAGGIPAQPVRQHWRRLALLDWLVGAERKLRAWLGSRDA